MPEGDRVGLALMTPPERFNRYDLICARPDGVVVVVTGVEAENPERPEMPPDAVIVQVFLRKPGDDVVEFAFRSGM